MAVAEDEDEEGLRALFTLTTLLFPEASWAGRAGFWSSRLGFGGPGCCSSACGLGMEGRPEEPEVLLGKLTRLSEYKHHTRIGLT